MKTALIRESGHVVATARIPEHWGEVTLAAFLEHERTPADTRTTPKVLSLLTGVPAAVLDDDVSLCVPLWRALDWFRTTLPQGEALQTFQLAGVTYEHAGNMHKLTAGQFEALADFLREHQENPVQAAPWILAVLYRPAGTKQTPESVAAAAEAFLQLPFAIAYPAIRDFLAAGASAASSIRMYSEVAPKAAQLLQMLEQHSQPNGASSSFSTRSRAWLVRTWIRSVRKMVLPS